MLSFPVTDKPIKRPLLITHLTEGLRTFYEMVRSYKFRSNFEPQVMGDGHDVIVLPGFLGSDMMTKSLRKYLNRTGYKAHAWDLGQNLGDTEKVMPYLEERIDNLYAESGKKISLIGWSLGGIYARQLAKSKADKIRQVITLCSPFKLKKEPNYATFTINLVYKLKNITPAPQELLDDMLNPPPVPSLSVFTKKDGIVPWEVCLETVCDQHKNAEVGCGHIAVIYNKDAYRLISENLPKK